jgi:hypothetical protein
MPPHRSPIGSIALVAHIVRRWAAVTVVGCVHRSELFGGLVRVGVVCDMRGGHRNWAWRGYLALLPHSCACTAAKKTQADRKGNAKEDESNGAADDANDGTLRQLVTTLALADAIVALLERIITACRFGGAFVAGVPRVLVVRRRVRCRVRRVRGRSKRLCVGQFPAGPSKVRGNSLHRREGRELASEGQKAVHMWTVVVGQGQEMRGRGTTCPLAMGKWSPGGLST